MQQVLNLLARVLSTLIQIGTSVFQFLLSPMSRTDTYGVSVLGLSPRASAVLSRNGISTVGELRTRLSILPLLDGIGTQVLSEILDSLSAWDRCTHGDLP